MRKNLILTIICSLFLLSCSKEEGNNKIFGKLPFNAPVVEWGTTQENVKKQMEGYTLFLENSTTLLYLGKDTEHSINYRFSNNKLNAASVLLIQPDESSLNFSNIFKNFESVSTLTTETAGVYLNAKMKTLGSYEKYKNSEGNCYFISWAEINNLVEGE